jgi:hypothetical protein
VRFAQECETVVAGSLELEPLLEQGEPGRDRGIVQLGEKPPYTIWARRWAEIINDARARLAPGRPQHVVRDRDPGRHRRLDELAQGASQWG